MTDKDKLTLRKLLAPKGDDAECKVPYEELPKESIDEVEQSTPVKLGGALNKLSIISYVTHESTGRVEVTRIKCESLPFLEHEPMLLHVSGEDESTVAREIEYKTHKFFAEGYGLTVDINVSVFGEEDKQVHSELHKVYQNRVNLFVDMGSTNSKWIVSDANNNALLDIPLGESTSELCAEWGLDYDKISGYAKESEAFTRWLKRAVIGFVLHIQHKYEANVVNVMWSFPYVIDGVRLDFKRISEDITVDLTAYYEFPGRFELVPEGLALEHMFYDRVIELSKANEAELEENDRRSREEEANKVHNKEEMVKADANEKQREKELHEYEDKNWFAQIFSKKFHTSRYLPDLKEENLGREEALKAFRNTGARGDGKFNLLILDAGGSTLDYCYKPLRGELVSGSFRAGGNAVTAELANRMKLDLKEAERRKTTLSRAAKSDVLREATDVVYDEALETIAEKVKDRTGPLCIIGSGLAMWNRQLRDIVLMKLLNESEYKQGQILMFSPDMVSCFPMDKLGDHPKFRCFRDIVTHVADGGDVKTGTPWPSSDVCGGMYFNMTDSGKERT